jgi:hypothetical protein
VDVGAGHHGKTFRIVTYHIHQATLCKTGLALPQHGPDIHKEINVNSSIELKRKQRFEFMNRLYELTDGNEMAFLSMWELGKELNLSQQDTQLVTEYLNGEGLLVFRAIGGSIGITHFGVVEVESALQHPDAPTQHFPPVQNIIHIETMTNSVIQQGNTNSTQTVTFEASDMAEIKHFLEALALQLPKLQMNEGDRAEARSEIATVDAQLSSPKPTPRIVAACLKTLLSIVENVGASVFANDVTAHLPAINNFIARLNF